MYVCFKTTFTANVPWDLKSCVNSIQDFSHEKCPKKKGSSNYFVAKISLKRRNGSRICWTGCANPEVGGANLLFWPIFPDKLQGNKEIGLRWDSEFPWWDLDPSKETVYCTPSQSSNCRSSNADMNMTAENCCRFSIKIKPRVSPYIQ